MEEIIVSYMENSQADRIMEEMFSKEYLLVKHCLKTKRLFFKKPQEEPETIILER
jgi:hypothetical protein